MIYASTRNQGRLLAHIALDCASKCILFRAAAGRSGWRFNSADAPVADPDLGLLAGSAIEHPSCIRTCGLVVVANDTEAAGDAFIGIEQVYLITRHCGPPCRARREGKYLSVTDALR